MVKKSKILSEGINKHVFWSKFEFENVCGSVFNQGLRSIIFYCPIWIFWRWIQNEYKNVFKVLILELKNYLIHDHVIIDKEHMKKRI